MEKSMVDVKLKEFYDAVKDPSWPKIKNYIDFYKLPDYIKKECYSVHGFGERKRQLEDCNYWQELTCEIYQHQNLVYVPILKCASTYYTRLFTAMGWEKKTISDIDVNSVVMFGVILHPFTRWVKGVTEWISSSYYHVSNSWPDNDVDGNIDWKKFSDDIQKTNIKKILDTVVISDIHAMPYTASFGGVVDRINWIPMDLLANDNDIKITMMNLFKKYNYDISIPLDTNRVWKSSGDKLQLERIVEKIYESSEGRLYELYKIYATDLKFYHNLIDTFDPNWQQIKKLQ